MRIINWVSFEGKKETVYRIKSAFNNQLEGKKVAISLGSFLVLYWFPPWSLGFSTRGTPNHSLITESFSFIGFVKEKEQETHLIGFSFYRIIFRLIAALYIFVGLLLQDDINDLLFGLGTFGLFALVVYGIFEKRAEDCMNEQVRNIIGFSESE